MFQCLQLLHAAQLQTATKVACTAGITMCVCTNHRLHGCAHCVPQQTAAAAAAVADEAKAGMCGTLVVVPAAIAGQWMAEIDDHSDVKVLHYTGLARHDRQG
jgi:hypothetical protein